MASLYRRKNSPYWWIKFRADAGDIRWESTCLRHGVGPDSRRARELVYERTLAERRYKGVISAERWPVWVPKFLHERYANKPQSHGRYAVAWRTLCLFLAERNVLVPRALRREDCHAYVEWRKAHNKRFGKYAACHNTALLELKTLGLIMKEAVLRGYAAANPCRELGLQRTAGKIKPALTEDDITLIRQKITEQREPTRSFLSASFEIARYQGCRLSETYLNPIRDIDIENRRITFRAKGGKTHVTRLHDKLIPLFRVMLDSGVTQTYIRPKCPQKTWFNFLKRIGLKDSKPNVCFHSLRVTVATELARNNVHESKAMRLLGHASTTVHRSYQRLRADDLEDAVSAIGCGVSRPTGKTA